MAIIDSLRNKGVNVRIMLHQPVMLDITIPPGFGSAINSINSNLKSIAKNVIWLNISNNELTENELGFLPSMSNLEKLRLEKNPITDKIIDQLAGLKHLEALNLNETNLTEVGIQKLKQLPGLKRVYQWNVKK
jgi:Leucine-rich repeat (LRR) protein